MGWPNYLDFGLTEEHVPELIRMATDMALHNADAMSSEVRAPLHAWRALGQLRAEQAIEPLIGILHLEDDWIGTELPIVLGMIGTSAIPIDSTLACSQCRTGEREYFRTNRCAANLLINATLSCHS